MACRKQLRLIIKKIKLGIFKKLNSLKGKNGNIENPKQSNTESEKIELEIQEFVKLTKENLESIGTNIVDLVASFVPENNDLSELKSFSPSLSNPQNSAKPDDNSDFKKPSDPKSGSQPLKLTQKTLNLFLDLCQTFVDSLSKQYDNLVSSLTRLNSIEKPKSH